MLLAPFSTTAKPQIISDIHIEAGIIIPLQNRYFVNASLVKKVLPIQPGDPADPQKIDQALSYLKKWGRFSKIDLVQKETSKGLLLYFTLQQGLLVSNIDIEGTYPYLENRLRRTLSIHPGEIYLPEEMTDQIEKLKNFYDRRGFRDVIVTLDTHLSPRKGTINLKFKIHRGLRYRFQDIDVHGNTVFPKSYFVSQLNPLLAYEPRRFREKIDKIRKDYWKKGYLNPRIQILTLNQDPEHNHLHPVLEILEGKKTRVIFRGNRVVSRKTLKSIMPMFIEGGANNYDLEISSQAALKYYLKLGFLEAKVDFEKKEITEKEIQVIFHIYEGKQTRVKKIELTGLKNIKAKRVKEELQTKENTLFERGYYQPKTLEEDAKRLPDILQSKGAVGSKVIDYSIRRNSLGDKVTAQFYINEGQVVRLDEIQFKGVHRFQTNNFHLKLHPGAVLTEKKLSSDLQSITLQYANAGYPYTTITPEVSLEGEHAILKLHIEEGPEVHIGEILTVGNERSSERAIRKSILFKKGDLFSYQKIIESERNLRLTGSYRSATIETIGLAEKSPEVHLLVKLEEYKTILMDLGGAYNTDTNFTGTFSLSHINLFGTNKRASLNFTGGQEIQKGEALFRDPHFLGVPLIGTLSGKMERQVRPGFTTVDAGSSLSMLKEFGPQLSLLGRYEILQTFFSNVTDQTGTQEEDHTTSRFSFSTSYDKRDSFSDPHKGYILLGGFDISNKIIASTFNFIQPRAYFSHFIPIGPFTLMNFIRIEGIKVFGADNLTRDRKLFLGGDYSVRGFEEDALGPLDTNATPLGGQFLLINTLELQMRLVQNFKLAGFFDNGTLVDDIHQVSLSEFRQSAGPGLRYITPVGALRLDYGFKLDRRPDESKGRLHFAFGYSF